MKKYIFAAVLSLAILASPAFTQAASLTQAQISAIVSLLQSFGADQTTINNVQTSLGGGTTTGGGTQPWCHTFNRDLTVGSSGEDVEALTRALSLSGITSDDHTTTFAEDTAADVVKFQAKYGIRQTGYVGPITRAKLNALYGCVLPPIPPPLPPLPLTISYVQAKAAPANTIFTGEEARIFGKGFSSNSSVTVFVDDFYSLNGRSASGQTNADGTQITFIVPNVPAGNYSLYVKDPNALGSNSIDITVKVPGTTTPSITVLSPNGGETWQKGSTQRITWNPTGAGMIDIRLVSQHPSCTGTVCPMYYPAPAEYVIAQQTVNDGIFEWEVGKNLDGKEIPEGKYTIRVSRSTGAYEVSDESDAPFSIVAGTTTTTPSITVLSPNGGEQWQVGSNHVISWSGGSLADRIGITLLGVGYTAQVLGSMDLITCGNKNAGNCSWSIPSSITPGSYIIRVCTLTGENDCTLIDFSDAPFSIVAAPPVSTPITLSSAVTPSSGPVGTSVRLSGCGSDSTSGFTLVYSGPKSGSIAIPVEAYAGAGNICGSLVAYVFKFTVPSDFPIGTYTLSVKNNQTGETSTNTKTFTVTAPVVVHNPAFSISPASFVAGAPMTVSVTGTAPNATIKAFCRSPIGTICDDPTSYIADASGRFTHTYDTTGWTAGTHTGWVTGNTANPFWSWRSIDIGFTVTASATAPVLSVTPKTLSAGTPLNISVNGISNAVLKVFCRDPNNSVCDDAVTYGTNSSGQFFFTYKTTGWTIGSYTGWVTLNGVKSNVETFTITAPIAGLSGGASQTASVFNAVSGFASGDSSASQAPATTFSYVWNRDLQIGSPYQGDIIALQQALTIEGVYTGELTGGFYNQTYLAVKAFQQKHGIDATGYVGLITRAKLNELY